MTHRALIYISQDVQRTAENCAEIPLCVGQLTGRCDCSVLCLCPSIFDVRVALEMVKVSGEVLIVSAGQKYLFMFLAFYLQTLHLIFVLLKGSVHLERTSYFSDLKHKSEIILM